MRETILNNMFRLTQSYLFGGLDSGIENPNWESADLRVCLVIAGNHRILTNSGLVTQLLSLVKRAERPERNVFVDVCFYQVPEQINILRQMDIPYYFGLFSLQRLTDFDVLMVSVQIHKEMLRLYGMFAGAGIPLFYSQRAESGKMTPLIIAGGVSATKFEVLQGHPKGAMFDLIYFGEGEERIPQLLAEIHRYIWVLRGTNKKFSRTEVLQKLIEKFDNLYFPEGYEHIYEGTELKSIRKKLDWLPDKVKFFRASGECVSSMMSDFVHLGYDKYASRVKLQISQGCSQMGCYFCEQGCQGGCWREYGFDEIKVNLEKVASRSAGSLLQLFSYNTTYHSRLGDVYLEAVKRFKDVSIVTSRTDYIAKFPAYLDLLQQCFRTTVFQLPLEGISDRIRNNLLNKNISWDTVLKAFKEIFKRKIKYVKVNLIYTGWEDETDLKEFKKHFNELLYLRAKYEAETSFRFSVVTLLHYWGTGIQWLPQKGIATFYTNDKGVFPELLQFCRDRGVTFSFRRMIDSAYSQALLDAGRNFSPALFELLEKQWEKKVSVDKRKWFKNVIESFLKTSGFSEYEDMGASLLKPRNKGFVHPSAIADVVSPDIQEIWRKDVGKKSNLTCLKNSGVKRKCYSCGCCDKSKREKILKHRLCNLGFYIQKIKKAQRENSPRTRYRVIYFIKPKVLCRYRSKMAVAHFIASNLLMLCRPMHAALKLFHSVDMVADEMLVKASSINGWGGFSFMDFLTTDSSAKAFPVKKVREVNASLETAHVLRAFPVGSVEPRLRLKNIDMVWVFTSTYDESEVYAKLGTQIVDVPFVTHRREGKTEGFFVLSGVTHPHAWLSDLLHLFESTVRKKFSLTRVGLIQRDFGVCEVCGEKAGFDLLRNKRSVFCNRCYGKSMLKLKKMRQVAF